MSIELKSAAKIMSQLSPKILGAKYNVDIADNKLDFYFDEKPKLGFFSYYMISSVINSSIVEYSKYFGGEKITLSSMIGSIFLMGNKIDSSYYYISNELKSSLDSLGKEYVQKIDIGKYDLIGNDLSYEISNDTYDLDIFWTVKTKEVYVINSGFWKIDVNVFEDDEVKQSLVDDLSSTLNYNFMNNVSGIISDTNALLHSSDNDPLSLLDNLYEKEEFRVSGDLVVDEIFGIKVKQIDFAHKPLAYFSPALVKAV
jgi:hypothetical protein